MNTTNHAQSTHTTLQAVLTTVGLLAVSGAIGFLAIVLGQYLPKVDKYLQLKARQDCAESYRLQFTDVKANTTVIRPVDDLYKQCLSEKGL